MSKTILIVDDTLSVRTFLKELLSEQDPGGDGGERARRALCGAARKPDLIFA